MYTLNKHANELVICCGKLESNISTSFDDRDNIRPTGVTSKNNCGARNTPFNMYLCSIIAARMQPNFGAKSLIIAVIAVNKFYVFFCF